MKKIVYSLYMFGAAMLCVAAGACSDVLEEVTEVSYSRLFSPTDLEVRVRDQVNAAVSWTAVSKAESYVLELYQGETVDAGTLVSTAETTDASYTFAKLNGDTEYAVRVKAVAASITDSKWVEESFETDPEQIFNDVNDSDLKAHQVTLTWPAGESVTTLLIVSGDSEQTRTLTDEEIAAGEVVVTGLTEETTYTFTILNGSVERGTITVTTLPNYTPVYPGDDLETIVENAEDGETIMLLPSTDGNATFSFTDEDGNVSTLKLAIDKNLTIRGRSASEVVTANIKFELKAGCQTFATSYINFSTNSSSDVVITLASGANTENISVEHCTATKYNYLVYESSSVGADAWTNILIDDCITYNVAKVVDLRGGKSSTTDKTLTVSNSTLIGSGSESWMRVDKTYPTNVTINVSTCTFYGMACSGKGILYVRTEKATVTTSQCLFAETGSDVYFLNATSSSSFAYSSNYYHNSSSLCDSKNKYSYDENGTEVTAHFKDAANYDFTLDATEDEDLIFYKIGDPRWY